MGFAPGDALRLALFKAEVAAGADERALAALTPLLNDNRGYGYGHRYGAANMSGENDSADANADDERETTDEGEYAAPGNSNETSPVVMPAILVSGSEKLVFALEVAKMQERLGQDSEAANWLLAAIRLSDDAGKEAESRFMPLRAPMSQNRDMGHPAAAAAERRGALAKRLTAARERVRVSAENNARRPVVQESIDQAVVVRPRLVAATSGGRP
jgi:hypothetical protein